MSVNFFCITMEINCLQLFVILVCNSLQFFVILEVNNGRIINN
jgi:hypothetical protein